MWKRCVADAFEQLVNAKVLYNCRDSLGLAFASFDAAYTYQAACGDATGAGAPS